MSKEKQTVYKIVVRKDKDGDYLEAFFCNTQRRNWRGHCIVDSMSFEWGHNDSYLEYYRKDTVPVSDEVAQAFATKLENYYNSLPNENCKVVTRKRLIL